jgi:hypothetical protein
VKIGKSGIVDVPPEATAAMESSALSALATKAGPALPIMRGRDPGLPQAKPIFDIDELRSRNLDLLKTRVLKGGNGSVGN